MSEPSESLSPMQELFCREYIKDLNGKQAAIRAGYSEKTAESQASRLLTKPQVAVFLQSLMDERSKRTDITADRILRRLDSIGDVDIGRAYDEKGNLLPIHEIPEEVRRCISGIKVFEEFDGFGKERVKIGEVREVKFWDKIKANELLGRHLKLFTDKIEHSGKVTLEDLVAGSEKKEE